MTRRGPTTDATVHDPYVDAWTPVHFVVGVLLALVLSPFHALLVLALWEPFVLLVLAPRLRGVRGLVSRTQLGGPTRRNVLIDLVADTAGVVCGAYLLRPYVAFAPSL